MSHPSNPSEPLAHSQHPHTLQQQTTQPTPSSQQHQQTHNSQPSQHNHYPGPPVPPPLVLPQQSQYQQTTTQSQTQSQQPLQQQTQPQTQQNQSIVQQQTAPSVSAAASYGPASPSTRAAAMSLGALAAAAASMTAAVNSTQPQVSNPQTSASIPTISQGNYRPSYSHPSSAGPHPHHVMPSHYTTQPPPPGYTPQYSQANAPQPRPKPTATPVAPAPSREMHHSNQPQFNANGKPKQRRYRATPEQLRQLIAKFEMNPSPTSVELQDLAARINMPAQSAVLWFKNRRARVPHKKAEKAALAAKRKDVHEPIKGSKKSTEQSNSQSSNQPPVKVQKKGSTNPIPRSNSFSAEETAAASMAELAMADTGGPVLSKPRFAQVGRRNTRETVSNKAELNETMEVANANVDKEDDEKKISLPNSRIESFPARSPSASPPPLYRRGKDAVPFDISLVTKLGSATSGAEFVSASGTARRPRVSPPTPRLLSQREYQIGDKVEVMETSKGICRSWYAATIAELAGPKELCLGDSAASICGKLNNEEHGGSATTTGTSSDGENKTNDKNIENVVAKNHGNDGNEDDLENGDGGDSPRTVRSPCPSPTPPVAKKMYIVEYTHRLGEENEGKKLCERVTASRVRPGPPIKSEDWRPELGDAVEVLRDGAWFVAVAQNFIMRKGYMVSFESGAVQWVRRGSIRPYQIWRGGDSWVIKTKPPLPVVRKSVGLSVTHPPGGKRKRSSSSNEGSIDTGESRETRNRSKRSRSVSIDNSGPDGLPEGWQCEYLKRSGYINNGREQLIYIAPDGSRLRSLKEAQRYVKLMGPG